MFLKRDCERILEINFSGKILLDLGDFIKKTRYRLFSLRVANATVDVEKEKMRRKCGAHAVTSAVVDETLIVFFRSQLAFF